MNIHCRQPDPFIQLGVMLRAWSRAHRMIVSEHFGLRGSDATAFEAHADRLEDSGTMLAYGYVARAMEKTGRNFIMQAAIVEKLVPDLPDMDRERLKRERQKVRQDIKRRADALEFFSLVHREYLSKVAVQFSLTDRGLQFREEFNGYFAEEYSIVGAPLCLAAE